MSMDEIWNIACDWTGYNGVVDFEEEEDFDFEDEDFN
jgi:hypothetical protein